MLFGGFHGSFALRRFRGFQLVIVHFKFFCAFQFFRLVNHFHDFYQVFVAQSVIAEILKERTDFQNTNHTLLFELGQVIEEIRQNVDKRADNGRQNQNAANGLENVAVIQREIGNAGRVGFGDDIFDDIAIAQHLIHNLRVIEHLFGCRFVDAETVIQEVDNTAARDGNQAADRGNGGKHTVDTLAADILLIVTDIGVDRRGQNLHKRIHQVVHPEADNQKDNRHPGVQNTGAFAGHIDGADNRVHQTDKHDIEHVGRNQHDAFAPFANRERREQHADKTCVLANQRNHGIDRAAANAAVAVKPAQNNRHGGFEETEPRRHGDDPEIFVAQNLAQRVHEANLNNVGFRLDDFFLGIDVNDNAQNDRNNCNRRVNVAIQANVIQVVVGEQVCENRHRKAQNRRGERIHNAFDCGNVRALLRIRGKHVNQVVVRFGKEVIEEVLNKVEQQNQRAGHDIGFFFAENRPFAEQCAEFVVWEPNKRYGYNRARDTHFDYVRTVFTLFASGIVDDIRADTRQRNVDNDRNEIKDIDVHGLNAERVAD